MSNNKFWGGGGERILFPEIPHYNTNMSSFPQKNMRNAKKQGMAHSQEKIFTETAPVSEEAQTLYLLDKDLKSNVLNMSKC